jgi:hypothetical protein
VDGVEQRLVHVSMVAQRCEGLLQHPRIGDDGPRERVDVAQALSGRERRVSDHVGQDALAVDGPRLTALVQPGDFALGQRTVALRTATVEAQVAADRDLMRRAGRHRHDDHDVAGGRILVARDSCTSMYGTSAMPVCTMFPMRSAAPASGKGVGIVGRLCSFSATP